MELLGNAALLVIDVQEGVNQPERGRRNNPQAEEQIGRLLDAWRAFERPVIHVKHNSQRLTSPFHATHPGNAIQAFAMPGPGEPLIEKSVNCAFVGTDLEARLRGARRKPPKIARQQDSVVGTDLEARLRGAGITTLVIVGFHTNHCVESTARLAGDLSFDTYVVSDATAAFDRLGPDGRVYDAETIHGVSLASISEEFATVVDSRAVLAAIDALGRASNGSDAPALE